MTRWFKLLTFVTAVSTWTSSIAEAKGTVVINRTYLPGTRTPTVAVRTVSSDEDDSDDGDNSSSDALSGSDPDSDDEDGGSTSEIDSEDDNSSASSFSSALSTMPVPDNFTIGSTANTTDKIVSTYRNWVGPTIGKPSDPAFDKACWRKAYIMKSCPYGYDYNTKMCWAQCPMHYPVECGFECIRQNDDCGSEVYAKFVSVANAFFSVQILGVFGKFADLAKNVRVGIKCARAMFGTMRAIVNYIRALKVSDPQLPQDKVLLALYQTSYISIDLPVSITMCMGKSYNWNLWDPVSVIMGTMQVMLGEVLARQEGIIKSWGKFKAFLTRSNFTDNGTSLTAKQYTRVVADKTYGVIVDDLIDKGKSDNGTSLTAKQYTRVVADKVLMTIATLFYVDLTRISGLMSEYIQTICGPTQLVGEIDDGTNPDTLGMRTVGKAFKDSSMSWKRQGDGVVKITFVSTDTKDVTVNLISGGDKFDEMDVPAGKTVTWTATVKELGGKTLYLDRWRPGFLGLPGTGGGSLKLWVPRASEGGHLDLYANINRAVKFSLSEPTFGSDCTLGSLRARTRANDLIFDWSAVSAPPVSLQIGTKTCGFRQ
ncbi:hypothetical protein PHMEG_00021343 [Phytophthora megakarya]|uniref:Uncharacterized protein n=1 Tax=Phytophthora megakarya TaxID=4795 RepID=A0A225VNS4_9STRA|nr:hypothetical protein PHMEG_00021343 [Phytophthora megakarya]